MRSELIHPKYRPDIDGLRAIAVLSVIGFHSFPDLIPGGFVGVDLFFVISGFLISTIIFESLRRNAFSFASFYGRRIRRIFPSLLVVLLFCLLLGWFVLAPFEYEKIGLHTASSATFIVNFILNGEEGYFQESSDIKPLLHLWSLGIEEQFYILCPLLWFFAAKLRINLALITLGLLLFSLTKSQDLLKTSSNAAFFLPQSRFWELWIGSLLAYWSLSKGEGVQNPSLSLLWTKIKASWAFIKWQEIRNSFSERKTVLVLQKLFAAVRRFFTPNIRSLSGFILIVFSIAFLDKGTPFPGKWALLPTLGAALLISAGANGFINKFVLSKRVLVWIGLISYPLYLWHYPFFSFSTILYGETPPWLWRVFLVLALFPVSWATYAFLEKPFRFKMNAHKAIAILCSMMILVGTAGYAIYLKEGLSARHSKWLEISNEGDLGHKPFFHFVRTHYYPCSDETILKSVPDQIGNLRFPRCFQSKPNPDVDTVIVGDSHAEHLFPGLAAALPNKNVAYYIVGAPPPYNNSKTNRLLAHIAASETIETVILSSRWFGRRDRIPTGSSLEKEISHAIEALSKGEKKKKIYLMDGYISFSFYPQLCTYNRNWPFAPPRCFESKETQDKQLSFYREDLEKITRRYPEIKLIQSSAYFCEEKTCFMAKDGFSLFRDRHHLNLNGTAYIARRILADHPELAK